MTPLVDMHCHLLAGFDDGPRTMEEAVEMCAIAYQEGVRLMAAGAHQNERYPANTADAIHAGVLLLEEALKAKGVAMGVFPCGEVMAQPCTAMHWESGTLMSVANRRNYLLLEMPHGVFVDLLPTVQKLRAHGIRPILAHPEREPRFLHEPDAIEAMIEAGCLVQVSSQSITKPKSAEDRRALKDWFRRGIVHVLGSDGHSPRRRPPHLADAIRQVSEWVDSAQAERIASANGLAIVHGLPLHVPRPLSRWQAPWWLPMFGLGRR